MRQTRKVCRRLAETRTGDAPARVLILQGEPGSVRPRQRTRYIRTVLASGDCDSIEIAAEKAAN